MLTVFSPHPAANLHPKSWRYCFSVFVQRKGGGEGEKGIERDRKRGVLNRETGLAKLCRGRGGGVTHKTLQYTKRGRAQQTLVVVLAVGNGSTGLSFVFCSLLLILSRKSRRRHASFSFDGDTCFFFTQLMVFGR